MAILERAAEHDPAVAYLVGYQYLIGTVAARDVAEGARWISSAAERGHPGAQVLLADLQEQGIGMARDPERAQRSRAAIVGSSSPEDRNGFAWRYSVSPDETLRNGRLAVEIMEALLASSEMVNAARLDTLAAAYAEVGRFDDAIAMQQAAIDRVQAGDGASPADLLTRIRLPELRARLEGYRSGQPYRTAF
jgi:TPR repeat protein